MASAIGFSPVIDEVVRGRDGASERQAGAGATRGDYVVVDDPRAAPAADYAFPILRGAIECRSGGSVLLELLRGSQHDDEIRGLRPLSTNRLIKFEVIDLAQTKLFRVHFLTLDYFFWGGFSADQFAKLVSIDGKLPTWRFGPVVWSLWA